MTDPENHESAPLLKRDALINLHLTHWQKYQPKMYRQFQQENRLQEELEIAAERFNDRHYHLVTVEKIPYREAWWMTLEEMLQGEPEEEPAQTN